MRPLLVLALAIVAAGCIGSQDGYGVVAQVLRDPSVPGLRFVATLEGRDNAHWLAAYVENEGPHTYQVSSICEPVFVDVVEDAKGRVVWPEPQAYCEAYGVKPFRPGERLTHSNVWNETLAAGPSSRGPAPPGAYVWQVSYTVRLDESSPPKSVAIRLEFSVR